MKYTLHIPGRPIPWSRARLSPNTATLQKAFYTQKNVQIYQARVRLIAGQVKVRRQEGPIKVTVLLTYRWPKTTMKKAFEFRPVYFTGRPDIDNLAKVYLDALNPDKYFEGAWADDSQVVRLEVVKFYGPEDQALVIIETIDQEGNDGK
jgi:Holliday junction resolvase RusA-like endonuclease